MQRYRVNFPLLIGLLVGVVAVGGAGYAVWQIQLNRNAKQLLRRAEVAEQDGDFREAAQLRRRYHLQRPEDTEAAERMANAFADILELPDVQPLDFRNALAVLETTGLTPAASAPSCGAG